MALQKSVKTAFGIELPKAYCRVENVRLSKTSMTFSVRIYNDPTLVWVMEEQKEAAYDLQGNNPISQAYRHLKTLPEFADAADC
jgi:hypothetical protein